LIFCFDGHDQRDCPNHQRDAAQHVGRRLRGVCTAKKQLIHGIERRSANVAVNDAQRPDGQGRETSARRTRRERNGLLPRRCGIKTIPMRARVLHQARTKLEIGVNVRVHQPACHILTVNIRGDP
jgi:hypothetical protein